MNIPDKVRIGGVDYRVSIEPYVRGGDRILYGDINYNANVIRISDTDTPGHQKRCIVLWHEILHGIAEHAHADLSAATEEEAINVLAKGVYQVLQDNPQLFERIYEPGQAANTTL